MFEPSSELIGERKFAGQKISDSEVIRIAVFGTTGVGKSTLCNLLCGETEFETSSGMTSCTDTVKSKQFGYVINNKEIMFEVIDCPGFFDTNTVLQNEDEVFQENIRACKHLTDEGISAYLLLIPYCRMLPEYAKSISFVRDFFPAIAAKYVWLIITKCQNKTADEIFNEMNEEDDAKKLIHSLLRIIDTRYTATECKCDQTSTYRESLLTKIYENHQANHGAFKGNGLWTAFDNQSKAHEEQKIRNKKLTKQNKCILKLLYGIIVLLIVVFVAFGARIVYIQRHFHEQRMQLQNQYHAKMFENDRLAKQYEKDQKIAQNKYDEIKSQNDRLAKQHEKDQNELQRRYNEIKRQRESDKKDYNNKIATLKQEKQEEYELGRVFFSILVAIIVVLGSLLFGGCLKFEEPK